MHCENYLLRFLLYSSIYFKVKFVTAKSYRGGKKSHLLKHIILEHNWSSTINMIFNLCDSSHLPTHNNYFGGFVNTKFMQSMTR